MNKIIEYKTLKSAISSISLISSINDGDKFTSECIIWNGKNKKFMVFNTQQDYINFYKKTEGEKCFHEVISGNNTQRLKFDIDLTIPITEKDSIPIIENIKIILNCITQQKLTCNNKSILIKLEDIAVTHSSGVAAPRRGVLGDVVSPEISSELNTSTTTELNTSTTTELNTSTTTELNTTITFSNTPRRGVATGAASTTTHSNTPRRGDATDATYKYSFHIIIVPYVVLNNEEAKKFTLLVVNSLKLSNPDIVHYIDQSVNKKTQNFRLIGNTKEGQNRYKQVSNELSEFLGTKKEIKMEDLFISADQPLVLLDNDNFKVTINGKVKEGKEIKNDKVKEGKEDKEVKDGKVNSNQIPQILDYLKEHHITDGYEFRKIDKNLISFNRTGETPECRICKRIHDNDNSLVIQIKPKGKKIELVEYCHRSPKLYNVVGEINCLKSESESNSELDSESNSNLSKYIKNVNDLTCEIHETSLFETENIIHNIYESQYMKEYEHVETLAIKAQMGCGKTKALRKYLDTHFNEINKINEINKTIRFVTFRQTFSNSLKDAFSDFTLYSTISGDIGTEHKKVIIQVESLNRLLTSATPIDLLILDEVESILGQFNSGLHKNFNASFAMFQWMLSTAKHVVCMDANLSDRTYNVLRRIRPQFNIHFHYNTIKKAIDDTYYFTNIYGQWLMKLFEFIKQGKRVVIPTNSLTEGKTIENLIENLFPNKKIRLYSSEMKTSEKNKHFSDITTYWSELDILIYSPTCSAGLSFEIEHFDVLFGYFTNSSCDVETCRQMLYRVRQLKSKEFYICFNSFITYNLPSTTEDIALALYEKKRHLFQDIDQSTLQFEYTIDGQVKYYESNYYHIWLETVAVVNLSKNNFMQRFVNQVADTGAKCLYLGSKFNSDDVKLLSNQASISKKDIKQMKATNISIAEDLNLAQVSLIREKIETQQDIELEEMYACDKYYLREFYFNSISEEINLSPEFVLTYNTESVKKVFKNLSKICEGKNIYDSLLLMQKEERELFIPSYTTNFTSTNTTNTTNTTNFTSTSTTNFTSTNTTSTTSTTSTNTTNTTSYITNSTYSEFDIGLFRDFEFEEVEEDFEKEVKFHPNQQNLNQLESKIIKYSNNYIVHTIINQIIQLCGFDLYKLIGSKLKIIKSDAINLDSLDSKLRTNLKIISQKIGTIISDIKLPSFKGKIESYIEKIGYNVDKKMFIKNILKIINSMFRDFYGVEISFVNCNVYTLQFIKIGKLFSFKYSNSDLIEEEEKEENNKKKDKPKIKCSFVTLV